MPPEFASLAADRVIDHLSGDPEFRSSMAVAIKSTGVVDAFIRIHADVRIAEHDEPGRVEVLQQINQALQGQPTPEPVVAPRPAVGAADEVLAFVSLARLTEGSGSTADVLALSTNLIRNIAPGASGAWFLAADSGEHLSVADAFGPAAPALRRRAMRVGEHLTGWVAANRQAIVNSDASLDLGVRAAEMTPPLVSCLSVPLVAGQTLVAVLSLYAPGRDAFSEDLGRLVQMVAPPVAAALDSAREHARSAQPQAAPVRDLRLVGAARRS